MSMVFPVVMYKCESWTIKKAEHQRIGTFELWCLRRPLRVPWTARRFNQSILKEISPGCSLEGLMLKLKLQYLCIFMQRAGSFEKTLMLGKIEGRRSRGQQRMRWLDGTTLYGHGFGWTLGVGDGQGGLACCGLWGRKESDMTEQLNWTKLNNKNLTSQLYFKSMPVFYIYLCFTHKKLRLFSPKNCVFSFEGNIVLIGNV